MMIAAEEEQDAEKIHLHWPSKQGKYHESSQESPDGATSVILVLLFLHQAFPDYSISFGHQMDFNFDKSYFQGMTGCFYFWLGVAHPSSVSHPY